MEISLKQLEVAGNNLEVEVEEVGNNGILLVACTRGESLVKRSILSIFDTL